MAELLDDCVAAAVDDLVARHGGRCGTRPAFDALVGRRRAPSSPTRRGSWWHDVVRVLAAWRDVDKALSGSADLTMLPALADMKAQVGRLVHRGFVADVGAAQLRHLPRYLAAVAHPARAADRVGRPRPAC